VPETWQAPSGDKPVAVWTFGAKENMAMDLWTAAFEADQQCSRRDDDTSKATTRENPLYGTITNTGQGTIINISWSS
jgi:hypothetical protein